MNYIRVIPRDLFNEANLLKWMGRVYIQSEYTDDVKVELTDEGSKGGFRIMQSPADGSIYVENVIVTVKGRRVHLFTGLNSRSELPLYAEYGSKVESVFDSEGYFTDEFMDITTE